MSRSRHCRFILSLAALLLAAAPALAEEVKVTLLLTNDIYKLDGAGPRGGFARLAGVVAAERAKAGNLIYAHAGDTISPSLMSSFDQG
ncbi:MAG TPA: bifunctional metallophosphatase/5'-nucleotidase, partial [Alphaproteobacteria bacterium]|nr:bifunctional metallophosphatase/5'-nucleotidase [Alphaproteobacteria bacterium]